LPRRSDSSERFHRIERRYGAFSRSLTLPAHVVADATQASTDDGVLQIVLPKVDQAMPKRITERHSPANIPIASAQGNETADPPGSGTGKRRDRKWPR
jgi:hypothetical protein